MQIKLFTIPVSDTGSAQSELNRFLSSHKILDIRREFISEKDGAAWCFCVRYMGDIVPPSAVPRKKIDYKEILDAATFAKFSLLRECRKQVAQDQAIPPYAILTDEEMSHVAQLSEITEKNMLSIKGIGVKKIERFGKLLLDMYKQKMKDKVP